MKWSWRNWRSKSSQETALSHFVYHSVLHPQTEEMPHHWQKLRVEESLFRTHLPFTILQPCAYMQNLDIHWPGMRTHRNKSGCPMHLRP